MKNVKAAESPSVSCDAVQGDSYEINDISVSNFVYPAFFDPKAEINSKLDFLSKLLKPFSMTSGGYQIVRTEPGKIFNVWGSSFQKEIRSGVYAHFGENVLEWIADSVVNKYQHTGRRKARI